MSRRHDIMTVLLQGSILNNKIYRRSGNFHIKNNLSKKNFVLINFRGSFDLQKFNG